MLCVRAACHLLRMGGIPEEEEKEEEGGYSYIRAIVPLPQLHVTSIYAAVRLCSPSSPPSSPVLTSQKRNRPSAVSKYGCTQSNGKKANTCLHTKSVWSSAICTECLSSPVQSLTHHPVSLPGHIYWENLTLYKNKCTIHTHMRANTHTHTA